MDSLFVYLLRAGACLALFYVFYRVALDRDTNFALNRAYLLGSAALSLVLPLVHVTSPFFEKTVPASALVFRAFPAAEAAPGTAAGPADVLAIAYVCGASVFLLLFLIRVARLACLVARCGCERRRGLRIVLCGHPGESFSFFNFVFLNKANIPDGDLDRVLAHELAHVRQLHSVDIIFTEILSVIQWFNPFVWPYKRSLRETHEYLADRAVIAQGCGLARYQLLIVEQQVGGRLLELASGFRASRIKRRIDMLTKQETKGLARWKPLLILPLAVALVLAFAESRTVVQPGPEAAVIPGAAPAPSQDLTEEGLAKALEEKAAQLEEMKKKNSETMAKLKQKLESATDPEVKSKIMAAMKEQKVMSLEIGAKERTLQVKKLEMLLAKEGDASKKALMEKKLEQLKQESEEYQKKAEEVRKAEEKAKQKAEKK